MIKRILVISILLTGTLVAQDAKVTPLLLKDLTGIPGKEALMITVEYAPGATDAIHRHNAHPNLLRGSTGRTRRRSQRQQNGTREVPRFLCEG